MDKNDRTLLDKTQFPGIKKKIISNITKTYEYTNEAEAILERVTFKYFDKFHPETQRTFSESRVTYNDIELPTLLILNRKLIFI